MTRALFGFLKGLIVGGAVGVGLLFVGGYSESLASILAYVGCAVVGALVGLICGRPFWKTETAWIPILRVSIGAILGVGLYALAHAFVPSMHLFQLPEYTNTSVTLNSGIVLAPAIGILYGLFVEIDDGGSTENNKKLLT